MNAWRSNPNHIQQEWVGRRQSDQGQGCSSQFKEQALIMSLSKLLWEAISSSVKKYWEILIPDCMCQLAWAMG